MASTYEPIATYTVTSPQSIITFSSLGAYTDIRIVANMQDSNAYGLIRYNSDSGTNYSRTWLTGNGTSATSGLAYNESSHYWSATTSGSEFWVNNYDIMNYSNTTTAKTTLNRNGSAGSSTWAYVYLWRGASNAAITTISFISATGTATIANGSNITLYGIKAA